jgi:hypothetical protein
MALGSNAESTRRMHDEIDTLRRNEPEDLSLSELTSELTVRQSNAAFDKIQAHTIREQRAGYPLAHCAHGVVLRPMDDRDERFRPDGNPSARTT